MKAIPALAATLVLLALSAGQAAPASTPGAAHASKAPTARVGIPALVFRPHTLEIGKGTKVVFANTDNVAHTATRRGSFDTGRIKPGRSAAVFFGQRGTFRYLCKIHPDMRGKIVVG